MTTLNIGTSVNLNKLIESRLLVQASSGGGKTYGLRVLAEQVLPHMPAILLDWDGELITLREKYDLVVAGPDGDVPCDPKSASLLALSLVKLQVSAVIDMSDLTIQQRREFARNFLAPLTDRQLKKTDWPSRQGRAVLICVDEAHKLCPQKEQCVSTQAVIDLQSLGRKRGILGVLATQRISKLDKDAAAECNNILVGRCHAVDSPRACELLGLPKQYQHELTQLETGEWRATGPAFEKGVQSFKMNKAQTTHAKFGARTLKPPAPSAKIQKMLPQLEALKNEKTQEVADLKEAKKEISNLKRELTLAKKLGVETVKTTTKVVDKAAVARAVKSALTQRERQWVPQLREANGRIRDLWKRLFKIREAVTSQVTGELGENSSEEVQPPPAIAVDASSYEADTPTLLVEDRAALVRERVTSIRSDPADAGAMPAGEGVSASQQKILDSLAWWYSMGSSRPNKAVVAVVAGYKVSGNFNNLLGQLRREGLIDYPAGGKASLTDKGWAVANHPTAPGSLADVHEAWRRLLTAPQLKLLDVVIENHPDELTKAELAEACGYTVSGNFNNLLGQLRKLGVITKNGPIKGTRFLFPEGMA